MCKSATRTLAASLPRPSTADFLRRSDAADHRHLAASDRIELMHSCYRTINLWCSGSIVEARGKGLLRLRAKSGVGTFVARGR